MKSYLYDFFEPGILQALWDGVGAFIALIGIVCGIMSCKEDNPRARRIKRLLCRILVIVGIVILIPAIYGAILRACSCRVPIVIGMTKSDALDKLSDREFTYKIEGGGGQGETVKMQVPKEHTIQRKGTTITLYFSSENENVSQSVETEDIEDDLSENRFATITFDAEGGSMDETMRSVSIGSTITELPTPEKLGFDFAGWFTEISGGERFTEETIVTSPENQTLYARWSAKAYVASWDDGDGCMIEVSRELSPHANAPTSVLTSGATVYYGDVLTVMYNADTGYSIGNSGSTSITVTEDITPATIYATATVNSYEVSWDTGEGYTITVKRASSPLQGASTGELSNGATIYYGDILNITYTADTGYDLKSEGCTSISVDGNVTSSAIYATAEPNDYTYNVILKSSNGTSLGSEPITYKYGTTRPISAPERDGYETPTSQTVTWDSTSAKTITFIYSPSPVTNSVITGNFTESSPKVTYSTMMNYRNRTATSVEVQITTTVTMQSNWHQYKYGIAMDVSYKSAKIETVQIASRMQLDTGGSSCTGSTGWMTIPLSTTNSTSESFEVKLYNTNWNNVYVNNPDYAYNYGIWTIIIPAY